MTCLVSTLTQWPYHARTCGVTETLEFWRSRMELSMIIGAPVRSTTKLPLIVLKAEYKRLLLLLMMRMRMMREKGSMN